MPEMKVTSAQRFQDLMFTPSDINQHLPTLYTLGTLSDSILECGVRSAVSSWAFVASVEGTNKVLHSVDLEDHPNIREIDQYCRSNGINYQFFEMDDRKFKFERDYDTIFIDTFHVYEHLKQELDLFHSHAKKFIVLHDTTVDETYGEIIRCHPDNYTEVALKVVKDGGYTFRGVTTGLWRAVEEFLTSHPEFELAHRYTHNNGLTVLRRRNISF